MNTHREDAKRVTPTQLLKLMKTTPADNVEGLQRVDNWKSKQAAGNLTNIYNYMDLLESFERAPHAFGPFSLLAGMQKALFEHYVAGPIEDQTGNAADVGNTPDSFIQDNERIEREYALLTYELCDIFIHNDTFDVELARKISSSPSGKRLLESFIGEFTKLENQYHSLGLTPLKAQKELMTALLMAITDTPLPSGNLPFMKKNEDGTDVCTFPEYLTHVRTLLLNLHRENAFDAKGYSERVTKGKIGASPYEVVNGSVKQSSRLRHYLRPEGIQPNGKVLMMVTPLINMPEILDLERGKSVIEALLGKGYEIYMVDHGHAGPNESNLPISFYAKTILDFHLDIIKKRHADQEIILVGYCQGGAMTISFMGRRAEEFLARKETIDIKKVVLMAAPVFFDDEKSGHGQMLEVIKSIYNPKIIERLFKEVNVPPGVIQEGLNEIQPGSFYKILKAFYERSVSQEMIRDATSFLYWIYNGTKFPTKAHTEWTRLFFIENQLCENKLCLPSSLEELNGKPVDMDSLRKAEVAIMDYRGSRDPISPPGSCIASETWGLIWDHTKGKPEIPVNRTVEKYMGHVFVVSKKFLAEFIEEVHDFCQS